MSEAPRETPRVLRARLAGNVAHGAPQDRVDDLKRALVEANLMAAIDRAVNDAPQLTPQARQRLAARLLAP